MFKFKTDLRKKYLEGNTISSIADTVGITREYLNSILCGSRHCSKIVAFCIVKALHPENEINDFFMKIKKGE